MNIATILLLTSAAFISVHGGEEEIGGAMEACQKELGLSTASMIEIMKRKTPEDLKKQGCYRSCLMKVFGIMKNSVISKEDTHAMIERVHAKDPARVKFLIQSIDKCLPEVTGMTEECEVGNVVFDCYLAEMDRLQKEDLPTNL